MEVTAEQIPLEAFLSVSAIIFSLGVYGVLSRRNAIQILMSVELMLNAVAVNFVAFAVYTDPELFRGLIFGIFTFLYSGMSPLVGRTSSAFSTGGPTDSPTTLNVRTRSIRHWSTW